MTKPKVDFYILQEANLQQARVFACHLLEKTYAENKRVFVRTSSKEEAERLDGLLWTFKDISFLPHTLNNNQPAPIQIGYEEPSTQEFDVLLNLAVEIKPFYQAVPHVIEIVFSDSSVQQLARDRYRQYREQQCEINTHKLTVNEYDNNHRKNL